MTRLLQSNSYEIAMPRNRFCFLAVVTMHLVRGHVQLASSNNTI